MATSTMAIPDGFFQYPYSLAPLGQGLRRGLWAPAVLGLLSCVATVALLGFIIQRFITWRSHYKTYVGYNQYIVLIMNLLLADLQQGMSFLVSFHWIQKDAILAPSRACFAQGWLLNIGDVASGFFVLAIAMHTFYTAVKGRQLSNTVFTTLIISTWVFALLLTAVGPMIHQEHYFVRAGAWCWASGAYETDRLALHYIWVFLVQFGTIIIYVLVLLHLKRAMTLIRPAARSASYARVDRAAKMMVLYPLVYIILTLPLSAGRMWSMAHHGASLPNAYSCLAGALIASSGFVDALLYTLTRRTLLKSNTASSHSAELALKASANDKNASKFNSGITQTRTVTITGRRASGADGCDNDADLEPGFAHRTSRAIRPPPRTYDSFERRTRSSTGSLVPIISDQQAWLGKMDGSKSGTRVEVRALQSEDLSDDESDKETASSSTASTAVARKGSRTLRAFYHPR